MKIEIMLRIRNSKILVEYWEYKIFNSEPQTHSGRYIE